MDVTPMQTATPAAYRLLHEGTLALADIEANGMRIDHDYLVGQRTRTRNRIARLEARLKQCEEWRQWDKKYGKDAALGKTKQLGDILFNVMGHECTKHTKTGEFKLDEDQLEGVGTPFARNYVKLKKLQKLESTYITGVLREVVHHRDAGIHLLHPAFHLNTVRTYRSSSSDPNFQNVPKHNKEIAGVIRPAFIARDGHQVVEIDFKGAEVSVAACYHRDPAMIEYLNNPAKDMHRDMASECFLLDAGGVPKAARQLAKGGFVFAEFYGDWWKSVAANMWDRMERDGVPGPDGGTLREHILSRGITALGNTKTGDAPRPGTYLHHIKEVEDRFWNERFAVYAKWKKDWWEAYLSTGHFHTLTGYTVHGIHGRNDVVNYPIQGSAFHCCLWSLIELNKWLKKYKMRTVIVGQVHDSIVADVHADELQDFLDAARYFVEDALPAAWRWITVPMVAEVEVAPVGGSWWTLNEWQNKDGKWLEA